MIEKETGGAYVHSLKIGHNIIDDTTDGFLMPVNEQIDMACDIIGNDTKLKVTYQWWFPCLSLENFITRFSFLRMYLNFDFIFSLGWLSLSWVFPRRSILKSSCTTVPKPTNEELSHDGRTTSRGLWNTKLSRRNEFHLRSYQKGNMS